MSLREAASAVIFNAFLLPSTHVMSAEQSYCDDSQAAAEWQAMAIKSTHNSDYWQRLHAMWLGLPQKVDGRLFVMIIWEEVYSI